MDVPVLFPGSFGSYDIENGGTESSCTTNIYPDGRRVDMTFDRLDRLVSKNDDGYSDIVEYEYIGNRVLERNLQNGVNLDLKDGSGGTNYDADRRPLVWDHIKSSTTVIGFEMQYDRMNNKIVEEKLHDSVNSEVYTYDSSYRVASLSSSYRSISTAFQRGILNGGKTDISTSTTDGKVLADKDWSIDGLGNWSSNSTTYNTGGFTGGTQTREDTNFNEYNKIGSVDRDHDENGNLIDGGSANNAEYTMPENQKRFEYDYRNRLRKVFNNNGTPTNTGDDTELASYQYDGRNRRIRKETSSSAAQGLSTVNYYYHGWQVFEERDGSDTVDKQYVYGNYIDEPIVLDDRSASIASLNDGSGGDRHFYHQNIQFNVHGLTDETGALVEGYMYDVYGRHYLYTDGDSDGIVEWDGTDNIIDAGASGVGNENLYTGQRFDEETKLYQFRNRYYNPLSGNFISRDPIGFRGGINLYHAYFILNGSDPYGFGMTSDEPTPPPGPGPVGVRQTINGPCMPVDYSNILGGGFGVPIPPHLGPLPPPCPPEFSWWGNFFEYFIRHAGPELVEEFSPLEEIEGFIADPLDPSNAIDLALEIPVLKVLKFGKRIKKFSGGRKKKCGQNLDCYTMFNLYCNNPGYAGPNMTICGLCLSKCLQDGEWPDRVGAGPCH